MLLRCRYGIGALRLAWAKRDILPRTLVERNHHVVRRYGRRRRNTRINVLQKSKPRFLRSTLNESEIENNQIVGVVHTLKWRRVQKMVLGQFEYELIKILRRHAKRIHQSGLNGSGYFCHPALVVPAFEYVNLRKRHDSLLFLFSVFLAVCS